MLKNIRALREEAGVSQKQLAEAIGVSQQSINKYENHNIEPDIRTLVGIADFFETSVDYVVGHTEVRRRVEAVTTYELNHREGQMLSSFRQLTPRQKDAVETVMESYKE